MLDVTTQPGTVTTTEDDGPEDNTTVLTSLAVVEGVLMVAGVFGNSMLFLLMRSKKFTKQSFSVYFSFAAVFNTLTIFWNSLQDMYESANTNELEEDASRSYTFGCGILEQFDGWFPMTSSWLMVFLCIDRYISICHPNASQAVCRRPVALLACCSLVFSTFIFELPWSLIVPDKADNGPGPVLCGDEAIDTLQGLGVVETVLQLIIPVVIVTVLNTLILVTLKKKKAFRTEVSLTEHGQLQTQMNKLNVTIFYLLVITAITWIPYAITNLFEMIYFDFDHHSYDSMVSIHVDYVWHVSLVLWLLTFVQDFYVLMLMSPVYRKEMRRQCACLPWCARIEYDRVDVNCELPSNEAGASDDD